MSRPWRNVVSWSLPLLAVGLMTPTGCAANGLIGGECADGYAFCDEQCISITDDELNCGRCDRACPRNLACIDSLCGGPDGDVTVDETGGSGMGGADTGGTGGGFGGINVGAGGPGGRDGVGGTGAGGSSGGTGGSGDGGSGGGVIVCTPPYNTAQFCGDCFTSCGGGTPNCAPDGEGSFECVANCLVEPFTEECGSICVDVQSDPRHCGTCNNRCDSGICAAGSCVGKVNGHMVAMCASSEEVSTPLINLLGNSVFLATSNPVRILAYTGDAPSAVVTGTNVTLAAAAAARGRLYEKTDVNNPTTFRNQIDRTDYDVLLILDQENAAPGDLASYAADWGPDIQTFTDIGGVVIVMGGGGGVGEMHELIDGLGIVTTTGTTDYEDNSYTVSAPGDALAIGLISPFLGTETSCVYDGTPMSSGELVYVTEGADPGPGIGDPGVVHRIIVP